MQTDPSGCPPVHPTPAEHRRAAHRQMTSAGESLLRNVVGTVAARGRAAATARAGSPPAAGGREVLRPIPADRASPAPAKSEPRPPQGCLQNKTTPQSAQARHLAAASAHRHGAWPCGSARDAAPATPCVHAPRLPRVRSPGRDGRGRGPSSQAVVGARFLQRNGNRATPEPHRGRCCPRCCCRWLRTGGPSAGSPG